MAKQGSAGPSKEPGPADKKSNSGDTKGYPDENPGREDAQSGKQSKTAPAAEDIGKRKPSR
jgi:hypothetical protein